MQDFKEKIHSQPLQEVLRRVDLAYQKFYADLRKGEVNAPRFKSRHRYRSLTFTQYGSACYLHNGRLHLSKIGALKIRLSRKVQGNLKTATIRWDAGHWWAVFSCDNCHQPSLKNTGKKTAIDYGLEHIATLSDGSVIEQPRFLKPKLTALRLQQRLLSKKKKDSGKRKKQRIVVGKLHTKIKNQRRDFQFKAARKLTLAFDKLAFEDHPLAFMAKNCRLAQSTYDRGIAEFKARLASQACKAGRQLVEISTRDENGVGNSQRCLCGHVQKKSLSQRIHDCPQCGVRVTRDHMAAAVIYQRAFGERPSDFFAYAVGQIVKSSSRAMLAAAPESGTLS